MTSLRISKITNALVELSLVTTSFALAFAGLAPIAVLVMIAISLVWWGFVHHIRFAKMLASSGAKAAGTMLFGIVAIVIVDFCAFGFGAVLRSIVGFK